MAGLSLPQATVADMLAEVRAAAADTVDHLARKDFEDDSLAHTFGYFAHTAVRHRPAVVERTVWAEQLAGIQSVEVEVLPFDATSLAEHIARGHFGAALDLDRF